MVSDNLSNAQLQEILVRMVAAKRSGTLFIHSTCKHVITIGLDQGRIVALFHGPKRGQRAIPLIRAISGGTYRFEEAACSFSAQQLPPTPDVLRALGSAPTATAGTAVSTEARSSEISPADVQALHQGLEKLLLQYLGPIAGMVLEDACKASERSSSNPEGFTSLVRCLQGEIEDETGDAGEASRFQRQAYDLLKRLLSR